MGICLLVCLAVSKSSVRQLLPLVTLPGSHNRRRVTDDLGKNSNLLRGHLRWRCNEKGQLLCIAFCRPPAARLEISSLRSLSRSDSAVNSNFTAGSWHTVVDDGQPKGVVIEELKIAFGLHTIRESLVELCSFTGRLVSIRVCQLFPTARRARYLSFWNVFLSLARHDARLIH